MADTMPQAEHIAVLQEMLANDYAVDEGAGMTGFSLERAALTAAIEAMQRQGEPVAWMDAPPELGHYWHFDGEATRMQFVFPRPGHTYLAVYDEPNPTTGKRQFRMAEKIGGKWYGPLVIPPRPWPAAGGASR